MKTPRITGNGTRNLTSTTTFAAAVLFHLFPFYNAEKTHIHTHKLISPSITHTFTHTHTHKQTNKHTHVDGIQYVTVSPVDINVMNLPRVRVSTLFYKQTAEEQKNIRICVRLQKARRVLRPTSRLS